MRCKTLSAGTIVEEHSRITFKEVGCLAPDCILCVEVNGASINRIGFNTKRGEGRFLGQ